jgi:hypothetical protein
MVGRPHHDCNDPNAGEGIHSILLRADAAGRDQQKIGAGVNADTDDSLTDEQSDRVRTKMEGTYGGFVYFWFDEVSLCDGQVGDLSYLGILYFMDCWAERGAWSILILTS